MSCTQVLHAEGKTHTHTYIHIHKHIATERPVYGNSMQARMHTHQYHDTNNETTVDDRRYIRMKYNS